MHYAYIIRSKITGEFYKGISENPVSRLREHNEGKTFSTKNKVPYELYYVHICVDRNEARQWEKFFKSGIGREVIKDLGAMAEWYTR